MNDSIVYAIGFMAQVLFSTRLILQWIASEKNKRIVAPSNFWVYSLIASVLLFIYGYLRNDFPIMLGQIITYYVYLRNLQPEGLWNRQHLLFRQLLIVFPGMIILLFFINNGTGQLQTWNDKNMPLGLFIWGICGQVIFTFRFIYQLIVAEKFKKAMLPIGFWRLSLAGSFMILVYAIFRQDPVLFVAQVFGFVVYTRNIMLHKQVEKI